MPGEAATTAEDAARDIADYEGAIHAIGRASAGCGIYEEPGISIKLSALHPRYSRAKIDRVMGELLPRLKGLAPIWPGATVPVVSTRFDQLIAVLSPTPKRAAA